jgi:hypothetical protein
MAILPLPVNKGRDFSRKRRAAGRIARLPQADHYFFQEMRYLLPMSKFLIILDYLRRIQAQGCAERR